MNVETIVSGLDELDRVQLARVEVALKRRLRNLEADVLADGGESRPVSGVIEYRPHADGTPQKEVRGYYGRDGMPKEQGLCWYFRYHEDGKQNKLHLGRTDEPEGELARKRPASAKGDY